MFKMDSSQFERKSFDFKTLNFLISKAKILKDSMHKSFAVDTLDWKGCMRMTKLVFPVGDELWILQTRERQELKSETVRYHCVSLRKGPEL